MMSIIWTLVIGLVAGTLAKLIMPGKDSGGIIMTMILGVAGAFIATYLGKFLGFYQVGEKAGFIGAILGSLILLFLYRLFFKK